MPKINDRLSSAEFFRSTASARQQPNRSARGEERSSERSSERASGRNDDAAVRRRSPSNENPVYRPGRRRRGGRETTPPAAETPVETQPSEAGEGTDQSTAPQATPPATSSSSTPRTPRRERIQLEIARSIGYPVNDNKPAAETSETQSTAPAATEKSAETPERQSIQDELLTYGSAYNYNRSDSGEPS